MFVGGGGGGGGVGVWALLQDNPDSHPRSAPSERAKSCWIICAAAALIKQQLMD